VAITSRLGETLDAVECHVLVDFTTAGVGAAHAMSALQRGVAPVIGTSGISDRDTREIAEASRSSGTPAMIVPNFAVGATLMLQFAKVAAKWMPHVEIIEMHHDEKADAPSGTAKRTAEVIDEVRGDPPRARVREQVKVEGVRGGKIDNIPVHSVRLRGLVAHQLVMFGNDGEVLTLRHDSFGRDSFMAGVELAVRHVWDLQGLTVGLDVLMR
jgi:4-hydroxy-tetrahydrodipicolinate reductase